MFNIFNQFGEINFDFEKIALDISKGFRQLEKIEKDLNVNLILVNSSEITNINHQYRNKNTETDVISFEGFDEEDSNYIGDVFINIEKVFEQANNFNHSVEREFAFLLCHGTLHLLGYDHLTTDEEDLMFSKQEAILNHLNYRR